MPGCCQVFSVFCLVANWAVRIMSKLCLVCLSREKASARRKERRGGEYLFFSKIQNKTQAIMGSRYGRSTVNVRSFKTYGRSRALDLLIFNFFNVAKALVK